MNSRLRRILDTVQDKYLHDPELAEDSARYQLVRRLEKERDDRAGRIWDTRFGQRHSMPGIEVVREASRAYEEAEEEIIEAEILHRIPDRAVHERRHAVLYLESDLPSPMDPDGIDTSRRSTEFWVERATAAHVEVDYLGDSEWIGGIDPIEDLALPPMPPWTAADEKAALEKAIGIYGLEPGQWMELEWPPDGHLRTEGHVYWTEFEVCEQHCEEYDDGDGDESAFADCADCIHSERVVESPAEWAYSTTLRIFDTLFDAEGGEYDRESYCDNSFTVMVLEQDPADILTGPPHPGRRW